MNKDELYNQYQQYISELVSFMTTEGNSQSVIAQEERNAVAEIEKEYMQTISELQQAKQMVSDQYKSVRDSCVANAGLLRPEAQRPAPTDEGWRECVRKQERAAKEIQEWFAKRTQQMLAEKKRKQQLEAERKAAIELSAAEEERKRKEEAVAAEAAKGASFLEELKRKYKKSF